MSSDLENFVAINSLYNHYDVEDTFFNSLIEYGLVEYATIEQVVYIHEDKLIEVERIIRLHYDLKINFEGIDTVLHLLDRIENLKLELAESNYRLRNFEGESFEK